ncbi:hypothetical protein [Tumebacillus flagellatus]|uniref:hypothetical protein n=1 Tax=Tumebacillus flagellatus TaxID=1157490 RepID=UPI0012698537|nr:hypothetical protein [Tumebacillus flagellatus]
MLLDLFIERGVRRYVGAEALRLQHGFEENPIRVFGPQAARPSLPQLAVGVGDHPGEVLDVLVFQVCVRDQLEGAVCRRGLHGFLRILADSRHFLRFLRNSDFLHNSQRRADGRHNGRIQRAARWRHEEGDTEAAVRALDA